jgi:hypothetical protein
MSKRVLLAAIVAAAIPICAAAQQVPSREEVLGMQTAVIILRDGEQLVIRGSFEVRDGLVLFFLDRGSHPVYSAISEDEVDFEATSEANQHLQAERERQQRYFRLIEERRRRLLEEAQGRPLVIKTPTGVSVTEEQEAKSGVAQTEAQFPAYDMARLSEEPEAWWRDEAARLFTALDACNAKLAELEGRQDALVLQINRARSEDTAQSLQQELAQVRQQLLQERELARLVGNRLTDLSIAAEDLGKPLDWILPAGSSVIDEERIPPRVETGEVPPDLEIPSYKIEELQTVEDSWWSEERQRLEEIIQSSRTRLTALRERYNLVIAERDGEQSEARKIMLNQQVEALDNSIVRENARLASAHKAYEELLRIARELGKEEALGLMTERQE